MAIKTDTFTGGGGGAVTGGLVYKGAFNATAGTPSIANAEQGDFYVIDTAGTIYGQTWAINDHLLVNADMGGSITNSKIDKIDNTEPTNVLITTNNLSDLDNATTARTNLGLGNVATLTTGVANGNVIVADATGLPVIDGSQLTGITSTDSTKLAILNNLSDLDNATTARTNLGLGNVATLTTGVGNGNVIVADATGLPAIDGSQLLNLPSGGLSAVVQDLTPQLGGDLDVNGQSITSAGNANVTINPAGAGDISIGADLIPDVDATHSLGDETYRFVSYYGDMNGAIRFKAKNNQGGAITKGQVVFISGVSGTVPEVQLARANSAATMPAFGLALNNANDQAEVQIITFGNLTDYNTTTYSLSANDTVYVSSATAGALTNTAPTGEANLIQNIGRVVRADASAGIIKVGGAGRSNATPNLDTDKVFLGNGSNQAVPTALSSINVSSLNDDLSYLVPANNLSDLNNATTARTNLGLGNVATLTTGVANGNVIVADATGLPVIDGSQLTGITSTDSTKLAILNNLSDLNNAVTARTNLGLGNVATLTTGVANGNVIVADATGLPVIDGSQLTGVTSTDSTKLAIANNLSDLNNAGTARTNLGLGNVATLTTGVANGNVIVADATGLPIIDGSQLTGITSTDATKLAIANNLSDLNNATTARTNLGLGTASTAASTDFLSGTGADTLGGDLDVGSSDIISSSNANIELVPDGTGKVTIKGNATSGSGQIVLNCELNNHGISLKGPPHSAAASYTLTFPDTDGTADQVLKTDGGGGLDWVDQASGGFTYSAITADPANAQANYHYSCGAGNQTFTVTLPTSGVSAGSEIRIKNMGTGDITIDPQTQTIDGVTTDYVLDVQYSAITLVSTGSNWEVI